MPQTVAMLLDLPLSRADLPASEGRAVIRLTRAEKGYALMCLGAIAIGAAIWIWAASGSGSRSTPTRPPSTSWPVVTRTLLTVVAGDSFLTTAVVHPEDLDR